MTDASSEGHVSGTLDKVASMRRPPAPEALGGTASALRPPAPELGDYEKFKADVMPLIGLDLSLYKEGQMKRRIGTLIGRRGCDSYEAYVERLKSDPAEIEVFKNYLTINVTEFFRDPVHWQSFNERIVPLLMERFVEPAADGGQFVVWCSACSTGEEAYSLAMTLSQHVPLSHVRIIASDVDERVLDAARAGVYTEQVIAGVPEELRTRFFTPVEGGFRANDELRACIEFRKLDLLRDGYPSGCHLVTCRNVLIYFTSEAKEAVFAKYAECLVPGGVLYLGRTEQIVNWKHSPYERLLPNFYARRED